ncbi:MAG: TOTE conflict system archaeo-eukaryotic primase domain-containing protein [Mediterraneibacter faecis]
MAIGNLIALPLQGRALKDGNSAFVDSNCNGMFY